MHFVYTLFYTITLPFILLKLWLKSLRQPTYRDRWQERLGHYPFQFERSIWVHAVSVGEAIAAVPLIKLIKATYKDIPIIVTTMTPTGAERVKAMLGDTVIHAYLPYDLPFMMERFYKAAHPVICIVMETEWWPNMIRMCDHHQIPFCLMNARLSEQSARGYRMIGSFTKQLLQKFRVIAAQSQAHATRLKQLGAPSKQLHITGSIKFDIDLPKDLLIHSIALRKQLGDQRPIWIAASTHEGEEVIILAAHQKICATVPNTLLILVPRHPHRFQNVAQLCASQFKTARRSLGEICTQDTQVYLGDTMGELLMLYAVSDVAFVAGSLVSVGGHNLLEPAALCKAIISGPHLHNFEEISQLLLDARALNIVSNADQLASQVIALIQHPEERDQHGMRALDVVESNRGSLQKQRQLLQIILKDLV
jgi:3-deoxy-D-manno-octulosonic-acid transferase